jgi:hypothetical protein
MEEPNANERKQTMGFLIRIAIVQGISKGARFKFWGKFMDFNYVT